MTVVDRHVDTNFLVSHWRRGGDSDAARYARRHSGLSFAVTWIVKGEFLRGAAVARHDPEDVRSFLQPFPNLWPDDSLLETYAKLFADLRQRNALLGPHDLWIAAAAVHVGVPLVTRNKTEFSRVPRLEIDPY